MIVASAYRSSPLGLILDPNYNEPLHPIHGSSNLGCGSCGVSNGVISVERYPNVQGPGLGWITADTVNQGLLGGVSTGVKVGGVVGLLAGVLGGAYLWHRRSRARRR
jgi:hypothetical protein